MRTYRARELVRWVSICLRDSNEGLRYLSRRFAITPFLFGSGMALDVGCFDGRHGCMVLTQGREFYVGIDISERSLHTAIHATKALRSRVEYVLSDARSLPFRNDTFGAVLCTEVLEHVHRYEIILQEIAQVLKKSGRLVLSVPSLSPMQFLYRSVQAAVHKLPEKPFQADSHLREFAIVEFHRKFETLHRLKRSLDERFNVRHIIAVGMTFGPLDWASAILKAGPVVHPRRWPRLALMILLIDLLVSRLSSRFGHYTIIIAEKK